MASHEDTPLAVDVFFYATSEDAAQQSLMVCADGASTKTEVKTTRRFGFSKAGRLLALRKERGH